MDILFFLICTVSLSIINNTAACKHRRFISTYINYVICHSHVPPDSWPYRILDTVLQSRICHGGFVYGFFYSLTLTTAIVCAWWPCKSVSFLFKRSKSQKSAEYSPKILNFFGGERCSKKISQSELWFLDFHWVRLLIPMMYACWSTV